MVTADQISHVERVVSRKYMNRSFLATALTAADRVDEQASTDGNRKLALLGKSLVDLILHDAWIIGNGSRDNELSEHRDSEANDVAISFASNVNLAEIAIKSGIDKCIDASPRQRDRPLPHGVLAKSIEAIVCAAWLDSDKDLRVAGCVLARLSAYGSVIPTSLVEALSISPSSSQYIDPRVLSIGEPGCSTGMEIDIYANEQGDLELRTPVTSAAFSSHGTPAYAMNLELDDPAPFLSSLSPSNQNGADGQMNNAAINPCRTLSGDDVGTGSSSMQASAINIAAKERSTVATARERPKRRPSAARDCETQIENEMLAEPSRLDEYIRNETEKCADDHPTSYKHRVFLQAADRTISRLHLEHRADIVRIFYYVPTSCATMLCLQDTLKERRNDFAARHQNLSQVQTNAQRYQVIESLQGQIAYLDLIRRYHILRLYTDNLNSYSARLLSGFMNSTIDNFSQTVGARGNPVYCAEADVTNAMLVDVLPDFREKHRAENKRLRRRMSYLRALGRRLYKLTNILTIGVLALLPSNTKSISLGGHFSINDECIMCLPDGEFERLVKLLGDRENPLKEFAAAAAIVMEHIFDSQLDYGTRFVLENTTVEEIMSKPGGSRQLLQYLNPVTSQTGCRI